VDGIDPKASCIEWSDTDQWKAIDAKNLAGYQKQPVHSHYHVSNLASETQTLWPALFSTAGASVASSVVVFLSVILASDSEVLEDKMGDKADFWVLVVTSCLSCAITAFLVSIAFTSYNSELLDPQSWKDATCEYTTSPTIGFYILVLCGLFSFLSMIVSTHFLFRNFFCVNEWWEKEEDEDEEVGGGAAGAARRRAEGQTEGMSMQSISPPPKPPKPAAITRALEAAMAKGAAAGAGAAGGGGGAAWESSRSRNNNNNNSSRDRQEVEEDDESNDSEDEESEGGENESRIAESVIARGRGGGRGRGPASVAGSEDGRQFSKPKSVKK